MLSEPEARAIAQRWYVRAQPLTLRLATTHRVQDFVHAFDTLVIEIPGSKSALHGQRRLINWDSPASAPRDALTVWHALSNCPGFSFKENLDFWMDALNLDIAVDERDSRPYVVRTCSRSYPRVVLSWDPRGENMYNKGEGVDEFRNRFLDILSSTTARSPSCSSDLAMLTTLAKGTVPCNCIYRFRLCKHGIATTLLVKQIGLVAKTLDKKDPLRLAGVELVAKRYQGDHRNLGLRSNDLEVAKPLYRSLPRGVTVEFKFPDIERSPLYELVSPNVFVPYIQTSVGVDDTRMIGRTRVLDLSGGVSTDFYDIAMLATLLPHARMVKDVRVAVRKDVDFLWLTFAMFHPESQKLNWKGLSVVAPVQRIYYRHEAATWPVAALAKLLSSPNRLSHMMEIQQRGLHKSNGDVDFDGTLGTTIHTATLSGPAIVQNAKRTETLTTLSQRDAVEVSVSADELAALPGDAEVAVAIPGFGIGWIRKVQIASIVSESFPGPARPCVTTLLSTTAPLASVEDGVLHLLGPSLVHLRSDWKLSNVLSTSAPALETADCLRFTTADLPWRVHSLEHLRSLGLSMQHDQLERCVDFLVGGSLAHQLHQLRLHTEWNDSVNIAPRLEVQVQRLLSRMRKLRFLAVVLLVSDGQKIDVDSAGCRGFVSNPRVKIAFLSVVRAAQHATRRRRKKEWLARLDSGVLNVIFDFCGRSLDGFEIQSAAQDDKRRYIDTSHQLQTDASYEPAHPPSH